MLMTLAFKAAGKVLSTAEANQDVWWESLRNFNLMRQYFGWWLLVLAVAFVNFICLILTCYLHGLLKGLKRHSGVMLVKKDRNSLMA